LTQSVVGLSLKCSLVVSIIVKMSDNVSVEEIRRRIRDGFYRTFQRDATKNDLWKYFWGIERAASCNEAGRSVEGQSSTTATEIPYVQCNKCAKVLSYDKVKGGTSHLRRHCATCQSSIRYDTIRYESLTWTGKLSIQLYLAHVARKRN